MQWIYLQGWIISNKQIVEHAAYLKCSKYWNKRFGDYITAAIRQSNKSTESGNMGSIDIGDKNWKRFLLMTALKYWSHWKNRHYEENCLQHNDSATNILKLLPSQSPQHDFVTNITTTHKIWWTWRWKEGFYVTLKKCENFQNKPQSFWSRYGFSFFGIPWTKGSSFSCSSTYFFKSQPT